MLFIKGRSFLLKVEYIHDQLLHMQAWNTDSIYRFTTKCLEEIYEN